MRRALLASSTVLLLMVPVSIAAAPAAHAGGGCHSGATAGRGDAVALRQLCFQPTTLFVEPGATVTFTNEDTLAHTVTGHAFEWGDAGNLLEGDTLTATFPDPGVYAYACILHPGMVGTVIVGDATEALRSSPSAPAPSAPAPAPAADTRPVAAIRGDDSGLGTGWTAVIAVGAALVGGAAALFGRRAVRRSRAAG